MPRWTTDIDEEEDADEVEDVDTGEDVDKVEEVVDEVLVGEELELVGLFVGVDMELDDDEADDDEVEELLEEDVVEELKEVNVEEDEVVELIEDDIDVVDVVVVLETLVLLNSDGQTVTGLTMF
jgi:hypothetical protein